VRTVGPSVPQRAAVAAFDLHHAHLGITVPGFPSLFLMYGPNTNTSGGPIIFCEEAQAAYIRRALELGALEVRDEHGRITTNWPGFMHEYAERTRTLEPSEFRA
jgi:cation diffusion facilitator CzcD-associated flavoprotein CzcO